MGKTLSIGLLSLADYSRHDKTYGINRKVIKFKLTAKDKTLEPFMQAILDMVTRKPQVQAHMNRVSKKLSMRWIYGAKMRFDGQIYYPASFTTLTKRAKDE